MARPWMAAVALAAACLVVGAEGGSLTDVIRRKMWGGVMFAGRPGTGSDRLIHQGMGHRRMRRNAEEDQATDALSSHEGITCEGRKNYMKCKKGVIRVTSAIYGRTDKNVCARGRPAVQLEKTDCTSDKTELVAGKDKIAGNDTKGCKNKKRCVTRVTNKAMDEDPCVGTFKYLEVKWECIKKPAQQTGNKKDVKAQQTGNKKDEKAQQTGNKKDVKDQQTGNKKDVKDQQTGNKKDGKAQQTGNKKGRKLNKNKKLNKRQQKEGEENQKKGGKKTTKKERRRNGKKQRK